MNISQKYIDYYKKQFKTAKPIENISKIIELSGIKQVGKKEYEKATTRLFSSDYGMYLRGPQYYTENSNPFICITEALFQTRPIMPLKFKIFDMFNGEDLTDELFQFDITKDISWFDYLKHNHLHAAVDISQTTRLEKWQLQIAQMNPNDTPEVYHIFLFVPLESYDYSMFQILFGTYGYFLTRKTDAQMNRFSNTPMTVLEFAPNTQPLVNAEIETYNYAYQIAPAKYDRRISKIGLVPKHNNELYNYPDRTYVLLCTDMYGNETSPTEIFFVKFAKKISKEKTTKDNLYSVWQIDLNKTTPKVEYHLDYTEEEYCSLWTTNNIRPEHITQIMTFDIDDFRKKKKPQINIESENFDFDKD